MSAPAQPSPLGTAITAYIDRKRSLGFKYDNEARILCGLDLFLAEHGHGELTSEGFHGWALTLEPLTPPGPTQENADCPQLYPAPSPHGTGLLRPGPVPIPGPGPGVSALDLHRPTGAGPVGADRTTPVSAPFPPVPPCVH